MEGVAGVTSVNVTGFGGFLAWLDLVCLLFGGFVLFCFVLSIWRVQELIYIHSSSQVVTVEKAGVINFYPAGGRLTS